MNAGKYQFMQALRPFSFSVALIVCSTGILAAYIDGYFQAQLAISILLAALLLQAGVNLINDYADLPLLSLHGQPTDLTNFRRLILRNFRIGLLAIFSAALIALYLIYQSGLPLLLLSVVGLIGALGYTLEPINYKRRGLAVILVFWFMGVLMVMGSYFVIAQTITWQAFLISVPVSLFTSLLLLSNELRDIEADASNGIKTLSVRVGEQFAILSYKGLVLAIYVSCALLALFGVVDYAWVALISLPIMLLPFKYLALPSQGRKPLTPKTGLSFMVFGIFFCLGLYLSA